MLVGLSGFENPDVTSLKFLKYSCMPPILKPSGPEPPTPPPIGPVNPTDPSFNKPEKGPEPSEPEPQTIVLIAPVSASLSTEVLILILVIVISLLAVACVVSVVLILRKRSYNANNNTETHKKDQQSSPTDRPLDSIVDPEPEVPEQVHCSEIDMSWPKSPYRAYDNRNVSNFVKSQL